MLPLIALLLQEENIPHISATGRTQNACKLLFSDKLEEINKLKCFLSCKATLVTV